MQTAEEGARGALVHRYEPLASSIARHFGGRGRDSEDLRQVALLGLVEAVDRFDPKAGTRFSTFAVPTIEGELRRYLRDQGNAVHVPRGMQELRQKLGQASAEMTQRLERAPTIQELSSELHVPEESVGAALRLDQLDHPLSLDGDFERPADDEPCQLEECIGADDPALHITEERLGVRQALERIPESHRRVIGMRYLEGRSREQTARRLGLTLSRVEQFEQWGLRELRDQVLETVGGAK